MFRVQVQPGPRASRLIGIAFLVIGLGLLAGSAFLGMRTLQFRARAIVVPGTVVNVVAVTDDEGDVSYRPVIAFTTATGQQVEFRSNVGYGSSRAYDIDDPVTVAYDPASPHTAALNTVLTLWFPSIVLGILGACFAGIGAFVVAVKRDASWRPARKWSFRRS